MLAYGRNTVLESLRSKFNVDTLFLEQGIDDSEKITLIRNLAKKTKTAIKEISRKELSRMTDNKEHQGVACYVDYTYSELNDELFYEEKPFIYIYDSTFEQNVGAIIRSVECSGFGGVIVPKDVKVTSTVAKISTGAVFHTNVIQGSIFQTIKDFKDRGYFIYGIERGGDVYTDKVLNNNGLYIIGGEDKSLSAEVTEKCDEILTIPQFGLVNSLNMSVAASIIMFEVVRQNANV